MQKMWLCHVVLLLVFAGCDDTTRVNQEQKDESVKNKRDDQAIHQAEKEETQLGLIISGLVEGNPAWKQLLASWKPTMRYFWKGRSLTPFDEVSSEYRNFLQEKIDDPLAYAPLHVLSVLIAEKKLQIAAHFIGNNSHERLMRELCAARAWSFLKKSKCQQARELFLLAQKTSDERLRHSVDTGLLLVALMENSPTGNALFAAAVVNRSYIIELRQVEPFVDVSEMPSFAKIREEEFTTPVLTHLVMADMLFTFGIACRNRIPVWHKGIALLDKVDQQKWQEVKDSLLVRFQLGTAWEHLGTGQLSPAKNIFQRCTISKDVARIAEAKLGLALIAFLEEEYLEDVVEYIKPWDSDYFWIGSRRIALFRKQLNRDQAAWRELFSQEKDHRLHLVMLDALYMLGKGREFHTLLGKVYDEYKDQRVRDIYIAEAKHIPQDVYADNKIWEMLD